MTGSAQAPAGRRLSAAPLAPPGGRPDPSQLEPCTAVRVNGREVTVGRCLLDRPGEPVAATVTVTVCLSVEDVTAVLVAANATYAEELPDDESLRALVAGAVLNNGCLEIEDWRAGPRAALGVGPGDEFEQYVRACHARAAEVFTGVVSHG